MEFSLQAAGLRISAGSLKAELHALGLMYFAFLVEPLPSPESLIADVRAKLLVYAGLALTFPALIERVAAPPRAARRLN